MDYLKPKSLEENVHFPLNYEATMFKKHLTSWEGGSLLLQGNTIVSNLKYKELVANGASNAVSVEELENMISHANGLRDEFIHVSTKENFIEMTLESNNNSDAMDYEKLIGAEKESVALKKARMVEMQTGARQQEKNIADLLVRLSEYETKFEQKHKEVYAKVKDFTDESNSKARMEAMMSNGKLAGMGQGELKQHEEKLQNEVNKNKQAMLELQTKLKSIKQQADNEKAQLMLVKNRAAIKKKQQEQDLELEKPKRDQLRIMQKFLSDKMKLHSKLSNVEIEQVLENNTLVLRVNKTHSVTLTFADAATTTNGGGFVLRSIQISPPVEGFQEKSTEVSTAIRENNVVGFLNKLCFSLQAPLQVKHDIDELKKLAKSWDSRNRVVVTNYDVFNSKLCVLFSSGNTEVVFKIPPTYPFAPITLLSIEDLTSFTNYGETIARLNKHFAQLPPAQANLMEWVIEVRKQL